MPSADYYREQARLLLRWAKDSRDAVTAQRLTDRAKDMIRFAERAETRSDANASALEVFNASQMIGPRKRTEV